MDIDSTRLIVSLQHSRNLSCERAGKITDFTKQLAKSFSPLTKWRRWQFGITRHQQPRRARELAITMSGSIVMIRQKTSDLKRRFAERTAERRNKKSTLNDDVKQTTSRNSSGDDTSSISTKSSMMNFAIASSTIASNCSSDIENRKASKHCSNLYRRTSTGKSETPTKVVHPVIHKRDIYLASRNPNARTRATPSKATEKKGINSRGMMNDIADSRGVMSDISNGPEAEAKTNLPAYSLTGSMLCREMEKGNIRSNETTANQQFTSPQKPMELLPSNTIMGSMLFRTIEEEEKTKSASSVSLNQYGVPTKVKTRIPQEVIPSPTGRSIVSEITMNSKESDVDPNMVKASKNLLQILRNNQFQSFDNPKPKPKPKRTLYEA